MKKETTMEQPETLSLSLKQLTVLHSTFRHMLTVPEEETRQTASKILSDIHAMRAAGQHNNIVAVPLTAGLGFDILTRDAQLRADLRRAAKARQETPETEPTSPLSPLVPTVLGWLERQWAQNLKPRA